MKPSFEQYRQLTDPERELIYRLLSEDFPGRDAVSAQLESVLARNVDAEGSLKFAVAKDTPAAATEFPVPVEGWFTDKDGVEIHILLHVVNGIVDELEIYKDDGSQIISMPAAEKLTIFRPE